MPDIGFADATAGARTVLHVGCGAAAPGKLHPSFAGWRELRLDIDPDVAPDIVATMTNLGMVPDGSVQAVFSAHNLEHLFAHEVPLALAEFRRVLASDGTALITLPDLQAVAALAAREDATETAYVSPMGPISALDMLYGHRASIAQGNAFMAHRTGFSARTLAGALLSAGFAGVAVQRHPAAFALWAMAFATTPDAATLSAAPFRMSPAAAATGPALLLMVTDAA